MLELKYASKNKIFTDDQSTMDTLKKGFFGKQEGHRLILNIFEALYLMDVRNAKCSRKGAELSFIELASMFSNSKKFIAKYFTYRDWRDRGLIIRAADSQYAATHKNPVKSYPKDKIALPRYRLSGSFFFSDLTTMVHDKKNGRDMYERLWFGQYGSYKAAERGQLNKLDIYETLYLLDKNILKIKNASRAEIIKSGALQHKDFLKLYYVYADWRDKGYIIKTGFKFGTNFRVYFPGATPMKNGSGAWTHSKHVIHVFPKESKLLISEWARAIRVAHSVRKTFILAVPGNITKKKILPDFVLYHRRGGEAENPESSPPRYVMLSIGEEEYLGGSEFAGSITKAKSMGLDLVLAITDRETAVTYYKVRQIKLPGSASDYYEIDWMQP
ncbi:MAG: tRNA-intron lyase [Candidatus Marsarchaeota archaeon]|jgi:tRNA-intron lyase|nr:tRNA-intron lyase [Candidatus Marsarchaeota archaeon]